MFTSTIARRWPTTDFFVFVSKCIHVAETIPLPSFIQTPTTLSAILDRRDSETTRSPNVVSIAPFHSSVHAELYGARRLVLALLGALGLGGTAELLGAVLPLLACREEKIMSGSSSTKCPTREIPQAGSGNIIDAGQRTLLATGLLNLVGSTDANQTVVRLELLQGLLGVVDQGEAGALATTILCAEAEYGDLVLVGLVQVGQLLAELVLGDIGAVGVEDVPKNDRIVSRVWFFCNPWPSDPSYVRSGRVCVAVWGDFCVFDVPFNSSFRTSIFSPTRKTGEGFLHDHLLAGKQRVADELASPQGNGGVGHFGGEW